MSLAAPVEDEITPDNPDPARHQMTATGTSSGPASGVSFATDRVALNIHGNVDSHIDALSHVIFDGTLYNGVSPSAVTAAGATELSIETAGAGIVGRGLLLDIPRLRGVPWLEPGEHVTADDLIAAQAAQEVRIEPGDLLFVRVGHRTRRRTLGPWDAASARAGLHPAALELLAERRIGSLGSDGNNDTAPSAAEDVDFPVHVLAINAMGLNLLDWLQLDDLAAVGRSSAAGRSCASSRRCGCAPRPARPSTRSPFSEPANRSQKEHSMDGQYDVIIIGTGAGGGTLARHLAPSGKRILLLERGDWLPREPENWSTVDVFVDGRYISPDSWYDPKAKSFYQPQVHYFVGGATKLYGAALYRMRAEDFSELRHHDGISPAWPISYADMEPYYTAAESMYEVHGARGEDPTEPPASAPYPFPAVAHEPRIQQLSDDLAAEGFHPFHAPCGVKLNEANLPYSICVKCNACDGFPCPLHAKSDAEVSGVRPALEHANVTLVRNARVVKLETNAAGTAVTEVVAEQNGETVRYSADIVVVSCGAANSAKLLLASASDTHPHGLANGSDQVGRNFMYHDSQAVLALSKEPNPTVFQKTLAFNDFYFRGPDFDYPMGNIQMIGKSQAAMFRGEKPLETKFAPSWALRDIADHAVDFWLSTEDLPMPDNRVTLGPDGGVHLAYTPSNPTAAKQLYQQLHAMLASLRMQPGHLAHRFAYLKTDIPVAGCAHQAGTVRFGSDPATSVLNADCRAHEVDNLYVVDTSFFPSISAVNPALTAMANAVRVGDHLLQRLG